MVKYFGDDYLDYMAKTGMIWPSEEKMPIVKKIIRALFQILKSASRELWHLAGKVTKKRSSGLVNGGL